MRASRIKTPVRHGIGTTSQFERRSNELKKASSSIFSLPGAPSDYCCSSVYEPTGVGGGETGNCDPFLTMMCGHSSAPLLVA